MPVMIFFIGALFGLLAGALVCVRYVRQEMMANLAPRLNLIQAQLDNLDAEVNLALASRLTELSGRYMINPVPPDA
jgi:hypothetical protein